MRRSVKIVSWSAAVLVALLAVLVIFIAAFNWNRLKPWLGDRVSQATGRSFAINGDLTVAWHRERSAGWWHSLMPWPQFTARDVIIGNPDWASAPRFAKLDALRFELSPLPLLRRRINVPTVQLVGPEVDLERDKDGRATWTFAPKAKSSGKPSAWRLQLGSIGFDQGHVTLDDAITRTKLDIRVQPLQKAIPYDQIVAQESAAARDQAQKAVGAAGKKTLAARAGEQQVIGKSDRHSSYQFQWAAKGSYQGAAATAKGKTGSMLAMQRSDRPLPIQADVQLGDSHMALVGTLTDPAHLAALDVRLWFSGSSMAKLYPLTGITLPDTPPYATEGHLTATLGKISHYSYHDFRGRVGGSDVSGDLDFVTAADETTARPKLSGKVSSRTLQFADLAPLVGAGSSADQRNQTPQPAGKVLPSTPFRTKRWRTMDADIQFSAAHIVYNKPLPVDALSTHIVMHAGKLTLDPLHVGLAGGNANGSLTLDGSRTPMDGALKLSARHLKLKQLFPTFEPMRTSFGQVNGDATLTATGSSTAALLGSSNGELKLLMNDGAISKALLETAGLNVGNIVLAKLFGDKTVKINCAAADLVAKDGVYEVRLFVFDTGDAVINASGTVNLATEQLDLDVRPHTRGLRVLSLRSPLYVRGTLKNPDVGVQKGPLLLRGAGAVALAAVAAPAAALLALIAPNHGDDEADSCQIVLNPLRHGGSSPETAATKHKAKAVSAK